MRKLGSAAVVMAVVGALLTGEAQAAPPPPVTFAPHADFAAGDQPQSVAVGDLDGDHHLDLVVADQFGTQTVSVLLGDGAGGFGAPTGFDASSEPLSIALGDLNGDGRLDAVVGSDLESTVSVLLGNGAGGFGAATGIALGEPFTGMAYAVALGDVNADARLDIVTANIGTDSVSVLLGTGAGVFGAPTEFATGTAPRSVALGQLSSDARLDLVTANGGASSVSLLLGNGTGGFGPPSSFAVAGLPSSVALGQVSSDTYLDVVVANAGSDSVSKLLGSALGDLSARTDFNVRGSPASVALGDLNDDGLPDLMVANSATDDVSVLLGAGGVLGGFWPKTDYAVGDGPVSLATGDLNADGRLDLVTANEGGGVSVLLNTPPAPTVPGAPSGQSAVAGNLSATVSWSPPSTGGSPIIGYIVTPYIGLETQGPRYFVSTATTQTVGGLANGTTYRFRVRAWNAIGVSGFSRVTNAVSPAPTAPGAPTIGAAAAGDGSATVSWTAPASDGGSPIIGYIVTPYIGLETQGPRYFVSTATTQTVGGLVNGTTYRFRVRAWNAIGVSGFSRVTSPIIPAT